MPFFSKWHKFTIAENLNFLDPMAISPLIGKQQGYFVHGQAYELEWRRKQATHVVSAVS